MKVRDLQQAETVGPPALQLSFLSPDTATLGGNILRVSRKFPIPEDLEEFSKSLDKMLRDRVETIVSRRIREAAAVPTVLAVQNATSFGVRDLYAEITIETHNKQSVQIHRSLGRSLWSREWLTSYTWHSALEDEPSAAEAAISEKVAHLEQEGLSEEDNGWKLSFEWGALQPQRVRLVREHGTASCTILKSTKTSRQQTPSRVQRDRMDGFRTARTIGTIRTIRTTRTVRTPRTIRTIFLGAAVVFALAAQLSAQNPAQNQTGTYDRTQVAAGAIIYGQCVLCHGVNGDQINGVDLRQGKFLTVASDADLVRLLATGRPGAGMPAFTVLRSDEVTSLIAYIRSGFDASAGAVKIGDPARGAGLFSGKGGCATCHRVGGRGAYAASDLSEIGATRKPESLQRALVDPAAAIIPGNRSVRVVTRDGRTIRGRRLNEDAYTIQVIDEQSRLVSLIKADLRSFDVIPTSSMPSYETTLTADERADLIAYLLSLKGR